MFSLWKLRSDSSAYKIMFFLGVLDIINLFFFGMLDGWLSMVGAVYCSAPVFLYIKGCIICGMICLKFLFLFDIAKYKYKCKEINGVD